MDGWMEGEREGGRDERTTELMNESFLPRFLRTSSNRALMKKMAGYASDFKYA